MKTLIFLIRRFQKKYLKNQEKLYNVALYYGKSHFKNLVFHSRKVKFEKKAIIYFYNIKNFNIYFIIINKTIFIFIKF